MSEESGTARPTCIALALKRRAFSRALRREVGVSETAALFETACEHARMGKIKGGARHGPALEDQERD